MNAWISWMQNHSALSMVIAGNTTMIHFLLGMDAFCVFYTPHAVHADRPGFQLARDLDIPLKGYVYCYPAKSNYLGGDIISGMIDTELYKKNEISVFFDIGTNGELVIGNKRISSMRRRRSRTSAGGRRGAYRNAGGGWSCG